MSMQKALYYFVNQEGKDNILIKEKMISNLTGYFKTR